MIYANNAATTRISDMALAKMIPFLQGQYGNAASQHSFGVVSRHAVEYARNQVAVAIGASPDEVIFTSGGSEGNSWVLTSIAANFGCKDIHIITSKVEHHSILHACSALEKSGVDVTYLPVDSLGRISLASVAKAVRPNTRLVSIMLANNEIGTIQPIAEIGRYLHGKNILFHTDAVQAIGHVSVDVNDLHVDFLTASAHKFNGAKGTGILYKRTGNPLPQLIFWGGWQEHGLRAGTENVAGIVAAGYALDDSVSRINETTDRACALVNGDRANCLPGIVNFSFDNVSGEALMHLLDMKGICVSTSSACSSGKNQPSHVLTALGLSERQTHSAIRISYGRYNTMQETETIITAVCSAYQKISFTADNDKA